MVEGVEEGDRGFFDAALLGAVKGLDCKVPKGDELAFGNPKPFVPLASKPPI